MKKSILYVLMMCLVALQTVQAAIPMQAEQKTRKALRQEHRLERKMARMERLAHKIEYHMTKMNTDPTKHQKIQGLNKMLLYGLIALLAGIIVGILFGLLGYLLSIVGIVLIIIGLLQMAGAI